MRTARRRTRAGGGLRWAGPGRAAAACAFAFALALAGCTRVHGVVRTEGAPLYADARATRTIDRLDKLSYLDLVGDVDDDPLEVEVGGRRGFCRRDDVRLYRCGGPRTHRAQLRRQRREVVLAEKPWPAGIKRAIRAEQLRVGMTREMVSLAWGTPASVTRASEGEVERWSFRRRRWDLQEVAYRTSVWDWSPWGWGIGFGHLHGPGCAYGPGYVHAFGHHGYGYGYGYGYYGYGWGVGFYGPSYARVVERRYVPREETYVVRFERGLVVSWGPAGGLALSRGSE